MEGLRRTFPAKSLQSKKSCNTKGYKKNVFFHPSNSSTLPLKGQMVHPLVLQFNLWDLPSIFLQIQNYYFRKSRGFQITQNAWNENVTTDITLTCFRNSWRSLCWFASFDTTTSWNVWLRCSKVTLERYRHKDREAILMPSVKSSALWSNSYNALIKGSLPEKYVCRNSSKLNCSLE